MVRLFARELLEQEEPTEVQQAARLRIAGWYAFMLEPAASTIGHGTTVWGLLTWFDHEHSNLLVAVQWLYQAQEWEMVWSFVADLSIFFEIRSLFSEWHQTNIVALDAARQGKDLLGEGVIKSNLGLLYKRLGYLERASQMYEESLNMFREIGEHRRECITLMNLVSLHIYQGKAELALQRSQESLQLSKEISARDLEGKIIGNIGNMYFLQGEIEQAIAHCREALDIKKEVGDYRGMALTLCTIGNALFEQKLHQQAIQSYELSWEMFQSLSDRHHEGCVLISLSRIYAKAGEEDKALELLTEGLRKLHPNSLMYKQLIG